MKIQSLAIMFIIIVLPISIVMQTYIQNRVETLSMQSQYDSKLTGATYDALKAYQINSFNSDTSYLANSKMRDIEAGVNTFFNSLATNFSTLGYNKESLQGYVPAVVFTMYDSRTNLSLQVVENVKDNLKQNIYKTIIPRNIRLAEAPSYGLPINLYDSKSTGAESYRLLAEEVMGRED